MLVLVKTMSLDQVREPAMLRELDRNIMEVSSAEMLVRARVPVSSNTLLANAHPSIPQTEKTGGHRLAE